MNHAMRLTILSVLIALAPAMAFAHTGPTAPAGFVAGVLVRGGDRAIVTCVAAGVVVLAGVVNADDTSNRERPVKDPELRAELLRRAKADQDVRAEATAWMMQFGNQDSADEAAFVATLDANQKAEFQKLADTMQSVDEENTARLGDIVDRHGWPTFTLVGRDGAKAAWLLVQHADRSPRFQRKCLDLMAGVPRDEISRKDLAYLTDRVLLAEGHKQRYGTQFTMEAGTCIVRPIDDEANVDARRAEAGLPPLAEDVKMIESSYVAPSKTVP